MAHIDNNGSEIIVNMTKLQDLYNESYENLKIKIIGIIIHEMTHILQYTNQSQRMITENIAEYSRIRSGCIIDWSEEWSSLPSMNVTYGRIPAYFWLNTEQKYPGFMKELNFNLKISDDINIVIKKMTNNKHQTLDSLWLEYQASLRRGEKTLPPKYI